MNELTLEMLEDELLRIDSEDPDYRPGCRLFAAAELSCYEPKDQDEEERRLEMWQALDIAGSFDVPYTLAIEAVKEYGVTEDTLGYMYLPYEDYPINILKDK